MTKAEYNRQYYLKNKDKIKEQNSKWAKENAARVKETRDKRIAKTGREKERQRTRKYYQEHKEEIKAWQREHREAHKEELKIKREARIEANKEEYLARHRGYGKLQKYKDKKKELRDTDPNVKLKCILRCRIHAALKGRSKPGSAVKLLGCTVEFLKKHIESLWKPGMDWSNWKYRGWHIDHIYPLSKLDLTDPEQFARACHYTNLQPLWWTDNILKSNKISA